MKRLLLVSLSLLTFSSVFAADTPKIFYKVDLNLKRSTKSYPMIQRMCDNIKNFRNDNGELNFNYGATDHSFYFATGKSFGSAYNIVNAKLAIMYDRAKKPNKTFGEIGFSSMEFTSGVNSDISIDCEIMKMKAALQSETVNIVQYGLISDRTVTFGGEHISKIELKENKLSMTINLPVYSYVFDLLEKEFDIDDAQAVAKRSMQLRTYNAANEFTVYDLRDPSISEDIKESAPRNLKNFTDGYLLIGKSFGSSQESFFVPAKNRAELEQFVQELKEINKEPIAKIYTVKAADQVTFEFTKDSKAVPVRFEVVAEKVREERKRSNAAAGIK